MGTFTGAFLPDPSTIKNLHISGVSADAISYYKVSPWIEKGTNFATAIGGTPSGREEIVYICKGPGNILGFHAKLNAAGVSTAVTVDLKKNGTPISTAAIAIANSTAVSDGTVPSPAFVAGDVLSLALAGTFTGAQGPYAWVSLFESNAPQT